MHRALRQDPEASCFADELNPGAVGMALFGDTSSGQAPLSFERSEL